MWRIGRVSEMIVGNMSRIVCALKATPVEFLIAAVCGTLVMYAEYTGNSSNPLLCVVKCNVMNAK